jgi:hypothetical protein
MVGPLNMTKILQILELQAIEFYEPTFNVLPDEAFTGMLLSDQGSAAKMVVDEQDWPLALAIDTGKKWKATNFILRPPVVEVVEKFEELGGEVVTTSQEEWMKATREHYSLDLMRTTAPALEDFSQTRAALVKKLISDVWGDKKGATCLDCGCGSGMGSAVLRECGITPLAFDNDPTLLSLGLSKGRLLPEETMWIDATMLGHYIRPTQLGLALMAGSINDFTALIWKAILNELMDLSEETMVTVENEKESELVKLWALGAGKSVEIFENKRDQFYDRWVLLIKD